MPSVNLPVISGGGWNSVGAFPANQNDGNDGTYQAWPGFNTGAQDNIFDNTTVPNGATISDLSVFGNWGAGSPPAVVAVSVILGVGSFSLGTIGDVTSYGFSLPRPGGGIWTKDDIPNMRVRFNSLGSGNGNNIRLKSSVLVVTFILGGTYFVALIH